MAILVLGVNVYAGDSLNCRLVGKWNGGDCQAVFVKDTFAFIGSEDYFKILNVANPSSPVEIGSLQMQFSFGYGTRMYVVDTLAYFARRSSGLRIINVANPAYPVEIGFCDAYYDAWDVYVVDTLAYLADGGLRIINVANPALPVEIGSLELHLSYGAGVYVVDTLAYLAGNGLRIINVANPASPVEIGFYDLSDNPATDVYVVDTLAYVKAIRGCRKGGPGLWIINVANPALPVEIRYYPLGIPSILSSFYMVDNLVYMANANTGLRIIDVANPASPVEIGFYFTDMALDVYVVDSLAYVANRDNGLCIIEYYGGSGVEERELRNEEQELKVSPNPFIKSTIIKYQIPVKSKVLLKIYDVAGRCAKTLIGEEKNVGHYKVKWDGEGLPTGIYFAKFSIGDYKSTKKLILIR